VNEPPTQRHFRCFELNGHDTSAKTTVIDHAQWRCPNLNKMEFNGCQIGTPDLTRNGPLPAAATELGQFNGNCHGISIRTS